MTDLQQQCLNEVNEILGNMEDALACWRIYWELVPENFKTSTIERKYNLLQKFHKGNYSEITRSNQLEEFYKSIYTHGAWEAANVINKFPDECKTLCLYLEIFRKNKCIFLYTPYKLRQFLKIDSVYKKCKYSEDGTCLSCTKSSETPCSYNHTSHNWEGYN